MIVDRSARPSALVGTPGTLHGPGNKASGVTDGIGTPPPCSQEGDHGAPMRVVAAEERQPLSSTGGGVSFHHPTPQPRERSVLSLCGKRKVWTNDRRCPVPCGGCEVLR